MPQAIKWKKNVTISLLIQINAMNILVWPHRVRYSPAWYEGGARNWSLTSTQRRLSFPFPHFPLTIKFIPGLGRFPGGKKCQLIPVFFPEKSHEQKSLAGYSPKGYKELDWTEH